MVRINLLYSNLKIFHWNIHACYAGFPPILSEINIVGVILKNTIATFTVEWNTLNQKGGFSIQVMPFPVSLQLPPVSLSQVSSTNITLLYDINYTLTIEATNCAGPSKTHLNLMRGRTKVS